MTRQTRFPVVILLVAVLVLISGRTLRAAEPSEKQSPDARRVLKETIGKLAQIVEPEEGAAPQTLTARLKLISAEGLPMEIGSASADVAFQAPSQFRIAATVNGGTVTACRDGNELWIDGPGKKFAVIGQNGIARFNAEPEEKDQTTLPPFSLPLSRWQMMSAALMFEAELGAPQELEETNCYVLHLTPRATAIDLLHLPPGQIELWVRQDNYLPNRMIYSDRAKVRVQVDVIGAKQVEPILAESWKLDPAADEKVEHVALSHLVNFLN